MRCFRIVCVRELCRVANGLLMGESMPESWKRSTVVPLYKGKGNVFECGNYHTVKLLEHGICQQDEGYEVCMGWCTEGGSSGSMQCVWKEGGCEQCVHNMWLLRTWAMFRST